MAALTKGKGDSRKRQVTFDIQSEHSLADPLLNCCLIPGLPDEVATLCLARVPSWHHRHTKLVSINWNLFFQSDELLSTRQDCSVADDRLYVFNSHPSLKPAQVYNPVTKKWTNLPLIPTEPEDPFSHDAHFNGFTCVVIGHEVLIFGGYSKQHGSSTFVTSKKVYKYDALRSTWKRMADMNEGRAFFACGLIGQKTVMVSGGTDLGRLTGNGDRSIRLDSAEVYDLRTNTWESVANMNKAREDCVGFVVRKNSDLSFLALGGYGEGEFFPDVESFSFSTRKWSILSNRCQWHHLERLEQVAYLHEKLYSLRDNKLMSYDSDSNTWQQEAMFGHDHAIQKIFGFKGELYVVPLSKSMSDGNPIKTYNPLTKRWNSKSKRVPVPIQTYNPSTKSWTSLGREGFASRKVNQENIPCETAVVRF